MTVNQISAFVENKPGQLAEFAKLLKQNHIDMRALSIAETEDFGILRIIVDDYTGTMHILKEAGYICSVTPVLAVAIPDTPGALVDVLTLLGDNDINLEYTYAFITRKKDLAYMILRVADNDKAIKILCEKGIMPIPQEDFAVLFN